jgi:hypothetical protein
MRHPFRLMLILRPSRQTLSHHLIFRHRLKLLVLINLAPFVIPRILDKLFKLIDRSPAPQKSTKTAQPPSADRPTSPEPGIEAAEWMDS